MKAQAAVPIAYVKCAARGCARNVNPERFLCNWHRRMAPKIGLTEVTQEYNPALPANAQSERYNGFAGEVVGYIAAKMGYKPFHIAGRCSSCGHPVQFHEGAAGKCVTMEKGGKWCPCSTLVE